MSVKKHLGTLTSQQRQKVESVARSYKHSERERKRARILILCDTSRPDESDKERVVFS